MKRRSTEIMQAILRSKENDISAKQLMCRYDISRRTLKNDINEINDFLKTISMEEILITEDGSFKFGGLFDRETVEKNLYQMDMYMYKLSPEERQIYIMLELIANPHYTTMHRFAEELYVSRITIMSDIDAVKQILIPSDAELLLDSGKGIKLSCSYEASLELLVSLYKKIAVNIKNDGYFQRLMLDKMKIQYTFSELFSYMQDYMKINNLVFIEDIFYDIVLYLFAAFNFRERDHAGTDKLVTEKSKLTNIDHMMLYAGYMLEVPVTEKMIACFRTYIEKNNLYSFVKTVDEVELYKIIMFFVSQIDQELRLELTNDDKLIDSLLMHIKSMKDWGNYEVEFPKNYDLPMNYELLETLVEKYSYILESFLSYKLSTNMKKSIVIHICVAVIRNRRYYIPKLSIVIVCPGSMATGKYLEAQIKNYFDFEIAGVLAAGEVVSELEQMEQKIDFILSTVHIEADQYKVITVNPFLTMKDLNLIQKEVFQSQKQINLPAEKKKKKILEDLEELMDDDRLPAEIYDKIESMLMGLKKDPEEESAMAELLNKEFITIHAAPCSWKEAIRRSAKPLEQFGYIEPRYTQEAIEKVEEYGDYIVVSQGVALAHAGKDSGVIQDGLSVLVSKEGICFRKEQHQVNLVFCFASTGEKEYLDLIKEIVAVGKEQKRLKRILKCNTKEEIYHALIFDRVPDSTQR